MTIDRIGSFLSTIAAAAYALSAAYLTYIQAAVYPYPIGGTLLIEAVQFCGSLTIVFITTKNSALLANILAAAGLVISFYNSVVLRILYKFLTPYVNYIVSQPSFYPYTAQEAAGNYKIFMFMVMVVFAIFWLRYTVIVKHNMTE